MRAAAGFSLLADEGKKKSCNCSDWWRLLLVCCVTTYNIRKIIILIRRSCISKCKYRADLFKVTE